MSSGCCSRPAPSGSDESFHCRNRKPAQPTIQYAQKCLQPRLERRADSQLLRAARMHSPLASRDRQAGACANLRITSCNKDACLWILPVDATDRGARILVGGSCHRASIKHDDFSPAGIVRTDESPVSQLALDGCPIGLGRTASKIFNVETAHKLIIWVVPGRCWIRQAKNCTFREAYLADLF